MKTIIVTITEQDESLILPLLNKFCFKSKVLDQDDLEDEDAIAKWINSGMISKDLPPKQFYFNFP